MKEKGNVEELFTYISAYEHGWGRSGGEGKGWVTVHDKTNQQKLHILVALLVIPNDSLAMSECLSVFLFVCLFVCLSVYLSFLGLMLRRYYLGYLLEHLNYHF